MKANRRNPRGLTQRESEAMSALIEHGTSKAAGVLLGVTTENIEATVARAKKRMGVATRMQMAVLWDRHLRGVAETQPKSAPARALPPNSIFQLGERAGAQA